MKKAPINEAIQSGILKVKFRGNEIQDESQLPQEILVSARRVWQNSQYHCALMEIGGAINMTPSEPFIVQQEDPVIDETEPAPEPPKKRGRRKKQQ